MKKTATKVRDWCAQRFLTWLLWMLVTLPVSLVLIALLVLHAALLGAIEGWRDCDLEDYWPRFTPSGWRRLVKS